MLCVETLYDLVQSITVLYKIIVIVRREDHLMITKLIFIEILFLPSIGIEPGQYLEIVCIEGLRSAACWW